MLGPDRVRLDIGLARLPRVAHLTTVDLSLYALLETELRVDVEAGCDTWGISAPGPYVERVTALGVNHCAVPSFDRSWRPGADLRAARELAQVLRRLRPDVLHTHTPKAGVLGRVLGRSLRVPVVVDTCHGLWTRPDQPAWVRRSVVGVEAIASQFAHAELYQNSEDARTMSRLVRRQTVVGNGVELSRFGRSGRERVRRELGIEADVLLVGGIGRLVREKGIEEFTQAARRLAGKAEFVWVGPEDATKSDALQPSVGHVRFLGERDDIPDVLAALDVFVLPSWREGLSRSGMEAAATGLPMVLSDIRGCRDIGSHEEHLLLVPPRDVDALVQALVRLLEDSALRKRLGAAARERALATFDQRAVALRSLQTYVAVARCKGLPWRLERT